MSENLTASLPESLKTIHTRHLFTMRLDVKPILLVGATPNGYKRAGIIPGGIFDGERLSGIVLNGGSDWQQVRPDSSVTLDVRLHLKTNDGDIIAVSYKGLRAGPPDVLKRIDAGEAVDPSSYYFRTNLLFETSSAKYAWLNTILAIGIGHRTVAGVIYNVFEIL